MDFGKYKYEQNKKAHELEAKQHKTKLKTVRLRPKTDPHILEIRVAAAREFLVRGDKVQVMILFRGREMAHQDIGSGPLQRGRQAPRGHRQGRAVAPHRGPAHDDAPDAEVGRAPRRPASYRRRASTQRGRPLRRPASDRRRASTMRGRPLRRPASHRRRA